MEYSSFSPNQLLKFAANDHDFVVEILQMFVQQAEEERQSIIDFANDKKWEELKFIAHRLRSSAGSVGASNIARGAAAIETYLLSSVTARKSEEVFTFVERFKENSARELAEIKVYLESLSEKGQS